MSKTSNHSTQAIPFLDLVTPHREMEAELVESFKAALATAGFIGGHAVDDFERAFADFCGASYGIGVGSGTDALRFALIAAGVNAGDAVVTVPNSFIATTEAISQAGAIPEFVDVEETSYNLDPDKLREYFQSQCRLDLVSRRLVSMRSGRPVTAIVPVHLYGQIGYMDEIMQIAAEHNLIVIEDACQAHGAEYYSKAEGKWKKAGSIGHAAAFSFYPGKNLGACGEAGAVTTELENVARKVRMLRDHGQERKYFHLVEGYNGRLDAIQAGFLHAKLKRLAQWNQMRRINATRYQALIAPYAERVIAPSELPSSRHVYHLYVVRTQDREGLRVAMNEANIGQGIHYPIPLHLQKAYSHLGYSTGDFPVTEKVASEIFSIPMFPNLTAEQQERVAAKLAEHAERLGTFPAELAQV